MGDKLRKFKIERQQEKHPFIPKREKRGMDEEDVACDDIRYGKRWEGVGPEPKENENQEA